MEPPIEFPITILSRDPFDLLTPAEMAETPRLETIFLPRPPFTATAQGKRVQASPASVVFAPGGAKVLNARRSKTRWFHSDAYQAAERELVATLKSLRVSDGIDPFPASGPLRVVVDLTFPYRTTERAAVKRAGERVWHDRRPDLDNLSKLYLDALVKAGLIHDDGQVAELVLRKRRGPREQVGIGYEIAALPE